MSIVIDATYEDGVLKPDTPLPLAEHEKVRVTVEQRPAAPEHVPTANGPSLGERIAAMARELPPEVIESWPVWSITARAIFTARQRRSSGDGGYFSTK